MTSHDLVGEIYLFFQALEPELNAVLEAEGVQFRDSGAVMAGTFWPRQAPFFA